MNSFNTTQRNIFVKYMIVIRILMAYTIVSKIYDNNFLFCKTQKLKIFYSKVKYIYYNFKNDHQIQIQNGNLFPCYLFL